MKQLTKPYSFLFYLLSILVFFIIGVFYVLITDAAKDSGLAGGAIVFGHGTLFSFIGLILSIVLIYKINRKTILILNVVLAIVLLLTVGYFSIQYFNKPQQSESIDWKERPVTKPIALAISNPQAANPLGMGFFKPQMIDTQILYFFGSPNWNKSLREQNPMDSLVFGPVDGGGYQITYAPPWFYPEHLKLDYDILFLKVSSITDEFVEVIVNKSTGKKLFVDRVYGELIFWPDFLLKVFSIEFKAGIEQPVHIKDMEQSSLVNVEFEYMSPVMVKGDWVKVRLVNDGYDVVGEGWIKWKENGVLLIDYSLLS